VCDISKVKCFKVNVKPLNWRCPAFTRGAATYSCRLDRCAQWQYLDLMQSSSSYGLTHQSTWVFPFRTSRCLIYKKEPSSPPRSTSLLHQINHTIRTICLHLVQFLSSLVSLTLTGIEEWYSDHLSNVRSRECWRYRCCYSVRGSSILGLSGCISHLVPLSRRYFAKNNFAVALLARGKDAVSKLEDEINQSGGQVSSTL